MYAVGVAGNMLYSAAGSGTMDEYMAKGLIENLNYDKNLLCLHRDYYMTAVWKRLLKVELAGVGIILVQYAFCRIWLRRHSHGPVEWLWKKLTWLDIPFLDRKIAS